MNERLSFQFLQCQNFFNENLAFSVSAHRALNDEKVNLTFVALIDLKQSFGTKKIKLKNQTLVSLEQEGRRA